MAAPEKANGWNLGFMRSHSGNADLRSQPMREADAPETCQHRRTGYLPVPGKHGPRSGRAWYCLDCGAAQ